MISQNIKIVRSRIEKAASRAGRRTGDITLVSVTKSVKTPQIEEAIAEGITDIGENYIQDAFLKFKEIGNKVRWHLIGHLQTNKIKDALRIFDLIHSVDSFRLAEEISKRAGFVGGSKDILIEVRTSEEASKYGVLPDETLGLVEKISALPNIKVTGLMTMAPLVDNPEMARPYFKKLRQLSEAITERKIENVDMRYLSMGMTQDFEVAIEEGANIVRIGRAIFEE